MIVFPLCELLEFRLVVAALDLLIHLKESALKGFGGCEGGREDWFYLSEILEALWLESGAESIGEAIEPLTVGGSSAVAICQAAKAGKHDRLEG